MKSEHIRKEPHSGFTLIELLVVIAIIGLLASVVLASLNSARGKARDAARVSNLREVQKALELYASNNNGQYPNAGGGWNSTCNGWTVTTQNNAVPDLVSGGYMSQLPLDPEVNATANTCCYLYYSGNGTANYKYMLHNCPTSKSCMSPGSATSGFSDPARTWSCAVYTPGGATW